jgi:hypothetical protein
MTTASKPPAEVYVLEEGRRYAALSASAPGTAYEVIIHSDYPGDISCNCKGYEFRRDCKHVRGLRVQLERAREEAKAQLELELAELFR